MTNMTRRNFIQSNTAASAVMMSAMVLPRLVLGGAGYVAPSEKVHVGYVGCGMQGMRQLIGEALPNPGIRVVAVCDPNRIGDDYGYVGANEEKRRFLDNPDWMKDAKGEVCGRDVGRDVTKHYYAKQSGGSSSGVVLGEFSDFREMLDTQKDLDAVISVTPDHQHGVVAMRSMRAGKHILTQKPMSNVLDEARQMRDFAREANVATQLFCGVSYGDDSPKVGEWLAAGAIGRVKEIICVSGRPCWPQGMLTYPTESQPIPDGFDWDIWQGPAAERPYHRAYTNSVFRGWFDFGSGPVGDMGCYAFYKIFKALGLSNPLGVQATRSEYYDVTEQGWTRRVNKVSFPQASRISWEFANPVAAGEKIKLHWYDGGVMPPDVEEWTESKSMPSEYTLYIGTDGVMVCDFMGHAPELLRCKEGFGKPAQVAPKPTWEMDQFVKVCRDEAKSDATFEFAYPFVEAVLIGNIALRLPREKLIWDAKKFEFTNSDEANALKFRKNRPGWEL